MESLSDNDKFLLFVLVIIFMFYVYSIVITWIRRDKDDPE